MSTRTIGIVWNPSKLDGDGLRAVVDDVFGADADVRWWETSEDDPGAGMAAEAVAGGCALVLAVGGDGTVRAVAESLAGSDAELAIVPQGTGNLLARNLGVPLGDLRAALERARDGDARPIDLGWVSYDGDEGTIERAFAVMIGFGLDAHMLVQTDDDLKEKAGWLAYVEALGRAVSATDLVPLTLAVDGGEPREVEAHTVLVGNCGTIQGGLAILPAAEVDDGLLDVLVVTSDGVVQWLDTVRSVVWDNGIKRLFGGRDEAVSTDSTEHLSTTSIDVVLSAPQPFEIDGEEVGEISAFRARVQPGALRVR
ncbi:diacylglycerol/lipid kinase family protein [Microbacterium sp. No. 7]|uniref:diacylglycerol/lipid kinase family protein n=1 Tax=Microbacterium sp. No. 7 TaxID=1714373 RepID=UPI0006D1A8DD|nr:diacylglycerol kinase family protein [Microbacterium sp. No. 7]ALJ20462.1 diacylglycerol kinase [Microbacterium sp. No. 7]